MKRARKKNLIIQAFENMDANMLDILLNDDQSYMDVSKEMFVAELRKYFKSNSKDAELKKDFKAFAGECNYCSKGKAGYSFINSDNECYMSLIFEESEDDFTDIYKCARFETFNKRIDNDWVGISFYEDDKLSYIPSEKNIREEKECDRAVQIFKNEIKSEGILSANFCINWYDTYKHLDSIAEIFEGKSYRYKKKVKYYLSNISYIVDIFKNEGIAKEFFNEFSKFTIISENTIKDWLIRCDYKLKYYKYGFTYNCNYLLNYFEKDELKIELKPLSYSQSICDILHNYYDWIPEINPLEQNDKTYTYPDDGEEMPF